MFTLNRSILLLFLHIFMPMSCAAQHCDQEYDSALHRNIYTKVDEMPYPLDTGVYEWAIQEGLFSIKTEEQKQPGFIAKFSSGGQDHFHYENGKRA